LCVNLEDGAAALQKYFSNQQSRYGRNNDRSLPAAMQMPPGRISRMTRVIGAHVSHTIVSAMPPTLRCRADSGIA
jgi:hypothetical protein